MTTTVVPVLRVVLLIWLGMSCQACYLAGNGFQLGAQLTPDHLEKMSHMKPAVAIALAKEMNTVGSVFNFDVLDKVQRAYSVSFDPATRRFTINVKAAHTGDVDMLNAAGDVAGKIAGQIIGGVVKPNPAPNGGGGAGPVPQPPDPQPPAGGVPAGAPPGATINPTPDDASGWKATDLMQKTSVNERKAMELAAGFPGTNYGVRAPTPDETNRFNTGLLMLGEFLAICGDNWTADERVRAAVGIRKLRK